jgi:hypothetical protein
VDFMKQIGQVATNYFVLCVLLSVQLAIWSFIFVHRLIAVS